MSCLLLTSCATTAVPVTSVTVRDRDFEVVKELNASEFIQFDRLWRDKKPVSGISTSARAPDAHRYHLDIARSNHGTRWLYDTSGKVQVLTVKKVSAYQVENVRAFNRLIGASR